MSETIEFKHCAAEFAALSMAFSAGKQSGTRVGVDRGRGPIRRRAEALQRLDSKVFGLIPDLAHFARVPFPDYPDVRPIDGQNRASMMRTLQIHEPALLAVGVSFNTKECLEYHRAAGYKGRKLTRICSDCPFSRRPSIGYLDCYRFHYSIA